MLWIGIVPLLYLAGGAVGQRSRIRSDPSEFDCEGKPSDVLFVLDASNSIWGPDFRFQLQFVNHVIRRFKIGEVHMQVGVITFSDRVVKQFDLDTFSKKAYIREAVTDIEQDGGLFTHTADALRYVGEKGFVAKNGHRVGVTRIAIVITDGMSYNRTATKMEASKLKEKGVHIFAIGVGSNYDVDELYNMGSKPSDNYVFRVRNYRTLDRLKKLLAIRACSVTDPPTTPAPTTTPMTTTVSTTEEPTTTTTTPKPTTTTTTPKPTTTTTTTPEPTTTTTTPKPTTTTTTPKPTTTTTTPKPTTTTEPSTTTSSTTPSPTPRLLKFLTPPPLARFEGDGQDNMFYERHSSSMRKVDDPQKAEFTGGTNQKEIIIGGGDNPKEVIFGGGDNTNDKNFEDKDGDGVPDWWRPEWGSYQRPNNFKEHRGPGTSHRRRHGHGRPDDPSKMDGEFDSDKDSEFPGLKHYHGSDTDHSANKVPRDPNLPCIIEEATDIVFVIDEQGGGFKVVNDIWNFIKSVISSIDMTNNKVRVKFVHDCEVLPGMRLGEFKNKNALLKAIDNLKVSPGKTAELLRSMTETLTNPDDNSVNDRKKIGIFLTDGSSGDLSGTLAEAQGAKYIHGIEMYGVGIGRGIDPTELRALVSCDLQDHLFTVPHSKKLPSIRHQLTQQLCKDS